MRGEFKLPTKLTKPVKTPAKVSAALGNDVYSSPYEVRVRPPSTFIAPPPATTSASPQSDQTEPSSAVISNTEKRV